MLLIIAASARLLLGQAESEPPDQTRSTYVLGPNDQIMIHALHAEELSSQQFRIEPDGEVTLPMIGRVHAAGETVSGLEAEVGKRLSAYYIKPEVTVTVTESRSQPISVVGAVTNPGVQQLQGRKTLLEVISTAGGLKANAGPVVKITRRLEWGRIPLASAHDDAAGQFSIAEVSVRSLLESRDPSLNIDIRPEDVISVPEGSVVYVTGEVKKPGGFVIGTRARLTVLEALAMAEGLQPKASPGHARILRAPADDAGGERTEIPINVARILAGKAPDVALKPTDILLIPNSAAKSAGIRSIEAAIQIGTGLLIWR